MPLLIAVFLTITVLFLSITVNFLSTRKHEIQVIKFSVKNDPGVLAKALVVFEVKINVQLWGGEKYVIILYRNGE